MHYTKTVSLLLLLVSLSLAQLFDTAWSAVWGEQDDAWEKYNAGIESSDGGVVVVGQKEYQLSMPYSDAIVVKYSKDGTFLWEKIIPSRDSDGSLTKYSKTDAYSIVEIGDGNYVIGLTFSDSSICFYELTSSGDSVHSELVPLRNNSYYDVGTKKRFAVSVNDLIFDTEENRVYGVVGQQRWEHSYAGISTYSPERKSASVSELVYQAPDYWDELSGRSMHRAPDGTISVGGGTEAVYSNGEILKKRGLDSGSGSSFHQVEELKTTRDGGMLVYSHGVEYNSFGKYSKYVYDIIISKYSGPYGSYGEELIFSTTLKNPGITDYINDFCELSNSNVLLLGYTPSEGDWLLILDPEGTVTDSVSCNYFNDDNVVQNTLFSGSDSTFFMLGNVWESDLRSTSGFIAKVAYTDASSLVAKSFSQQNRLHVQRNNSTLKFQSNSGDITSVSLYNSAGKRVALQEGNRSDVELSLSSLAAGTYFYQVQTTENSESGKFLFIE